MTVYNVPKSEGAKKGNRFAFRAVDGGKVFSVPFLQYLSGDGAEFIETSIEGGRADEARLTRGLIAIECPAAAEAVRKMANDQVIGLSQAWAAASTASLGESEGSEDS